MTYSIPPNEASQEMLKILGFDDSKVLEFKIKVRMGEPITIEVKQLLEVQEIKKLVQIIRKFNIVEDV